MQDQSLPYTKRTYRIDEFTKIYGIGRTKAYMEIKAGRLKIIKVGKTTLIHHDDAEAWLKSYQGGN